MTNQKNYFKKLEKVKTIQCDKFRRDNASFWERLLNLINTIWKKFYVPKLSTNFL